MCARELAHSLETLGGTDSNRKKTNETKARKWTERNRSLGLATCWGVLHRLNGKYGNSSYLKERWDYSSECTRVCLQLRALSSNFVDTHGWWLQQCSCWWLHWHLYGWCNVDARFQGRLLGGDASGLVINRFQFTFRIAAVPTQRLRNQTKKKDCS